MSSIRTILVVAPLCALFAAALAVASRQPPATAAPAPRADKFPSTYVDDKGTIRLPEDYRLKWTHLGSWSVTEAGGDKTMHNVYAQPDAVAAFVKSGSWPDGATIVKEVRSGNEAALTTGNARWEAEIKVWFVMVKDSKKSFPENPNWGRGWGWALFEHDKPGENASTDYKLDCVSCHVPAQSTDWVYQHGYAVLNEKDGPRPAYKPETYLPAAK